MVNKRAVKSLGSGEGQLTESVDVGVVDLGAEEALGGDHWVLFGQEQLKVEESTLVGGVSRACDSHKEVSAVGL